MTSSILQTATRFLMPLFLLFAVFLLLRGHNEPGGGFAGVSLSLRRSCPMRLRTVFRVATRTAGGPLDASRCRAAGRRRKRYAGGSARPVVHDRSVDDVGVGR